MKTVRIRREGFVAILVAALLITACVEASEFGVDLRLKASTVNDRREYLQGMPIIVKTWIVNRDSVRQFNWEQGEKGWGRVFEHKEIRVKITSADIGWHKNVTFQVNRISRTDDEITARRNVGDLGLNANLMFYGSQHPKGGTLVDMGTARMQWYITPEVTSTLVPGEYEIQATFDNASLSDDPDIHAGRVVSNAFVISLREAVNNNDQVKISLASARYYEKLRMYDKEIEAATKALQLDPGCHRAHLILGDAYRITGDFAKAVPEYELYIAYLRSLPPADAEDGHDDYADVLEMSVKGWKKKLEMQ